MTGNSETPCYGVCEGETLLSVIAGLLLVSLVVPALPVVCEYPQCRSSQSCASPWLLACSTLLL